MSKDLVIKVGEYEKDGEKKGRYVKLGIILDGENGEYALIDPTVNLAGCMIRQRVMNPQKAGDSVMCSIFSRDRDQSSGGSPKLNDDFDDDLPF